MNFTTNSTTSWLEMIVNSFGYGLWITADYIMLILVPSLLGMLSEALCLIVFSRIKVVSNLYIYVKAYTVNNMVVCGCLFFQFFYAIYSLGDPETLTVSNSYLIYPFMNCLFLNGTLLDIVILLDRIAVFSKRVKGLISLISPYKQILLLAIISTIFTIPYFFLYEPMVIHSTSPEGVEYIVWISGSSPFSSTSFGNALIILIVGVEYVAVMVIQIVLNIYSMICMRHHIQEKKLIVNIKHARGSNHQNVELKNSMMVTILCFFSFVEHVLFISCNVGQFFFVKQIDLVLLQKITYFFLGLKRSTDFLFYMKFNKVFKQHISFRLSVSPN